MYSLLYTYIICTIISAIVHCRFVDCDLRCETYRESRHGTAGRGEGVTSRCQTVPRLRDVPKGAHNWFANQSIDKYYWLVSADFSIRSIPYECPTFACQIFRIVNSTRSHVAPSCRQITVKGFPPYLYAPMIMYIRYYFITFLLQGRIRFEKKEKEKKDRYPSIYMRYTFD